jgi:hypothetical protein
MASNYGLNFGFRVSDESYRSGNVGDFMVPTTGIFTQGMVVEVDPANPGYIKKSAADAPVEPSFRGLLIQEDSFLHDIHTNQVKSSVDLAAVRNGALCSIWTGAGIQVWLKNTKATARLGQRPAAAVDIVVAVGLNVGDFLSWDGAKFVKAASAAVAIGRVLHTNGPGAGADYAEMALLR